MQNNDNLTFKMLCCFSMLAILFLLAFSAASWALFYDAETERLSSEKAKNMRIASICVVVFSILAITFFLIWFLTMFRERSTL